MKKKWLIVPVLAVLLLAALLPGKTKASVLLGICRRQMEHHAMLCAADPEGTDRFGLWKSDYHPVFGVVTFQISYVGFGSQADKKGLYYAPQDTMTGLGNNGTPAAVGEGFLFPGEGDNRTYVEKLAFRWYWYEQHW